MAIGTALGFSQWGTVALAFVFGSSVLIAEAVSEDDEPAPHGHEVAAIRAR